MEKVARELLAVPQRRLMDDGADVVDAEFGRLAPNFVRVEDLDRLADTPFARATLARIWESSCGSMKRKKPVST